jgi:hypothetical protein
MGFNRDSFVGDWQRWTERRRARRLPRIPERRLASASRRELSIFCGFVRPRAGRPPLRAPLSGEATLGYLLELSLGDGSFAMAIGAVDALEIDDGTARGVIPRTSALLLGALEVGSYRPLRVHREHEDVVTLFRHRGLDLAWASRRSPGLVLREHRLPSSLSTQVWLAAERRAVDPDGTFELGRTRDLALLLSTEQPRRLLRRSKRDKALLVAQRADGLISELIPPGGYDSSFV